MSNQAHWTRLLLLFAIALFAIGCGGTEVAEDEPTETTETEETEEIEETEDAEEAEETAEEDDVIKVGILHSLSGTMAISEVSVRDSTLLAIEQINAAGGVLGKQLVPVVEDGASDWPTFAEKARKLILEDEVDVVFGGWTSASRKAMLPVFEELNGLLFYPVQYEGLEASPNIFYTGAEPTQQIIPGVEYLLEEGKTNIYLVGSDYVFPRTANKIIKAQLDDAGVTLAGEQYIPLGDTDFQTIIAEIQDVQPDAIFNTLNGDSNVAFFKQFVDAGYTASDIPIMSVSVAEEEVKSIGTEFLGGHLVSWNYYETVDSPENEAFVEAYHEFTDGRPTSDPVESAYISVNVWAKLAEAAGSTDVEAIQQAADDNEITFQAPGGLISVDGVTQHMAKTPRVGLINDDGSISTVWSTEGPVFPDPFLLGVDWAEGLIDESEIPDAVLNAGDEEAMGEMEEMAACEEPIKVGILHSLSGTMAISEVSVRDSTLLAIDQINEAGGLLGCPIEAIVEDGASDWPTFAEKARKLIQEDEVAVVFGGWTSASRKAMLPVFEELNGLLFYPVQYEGLEASPNIFYTGAEPTQQIIPGVEYLLEEGKTNIYLVGSDYVFPRTANKIIKAQLEDAGVSLAGEQYIPLGDTDFQTIIAEIQSVQPDAIFNTLNGDSNVAFFKQFVDAGYTADDIPIMSVSVAEEEVKSIGTEFLGGHLVSWNYYETVDSPENVAFVEAYHEYTDSRPTSDPVESAYISVNVWALLVDAAGSTEVAAIQQAADDNEITFQSPGGLITVDGASQHMAKTPRIGLINDDGSISTVWSTDGPVFPDPFLLGVEWAAGLVDESEIPEALLP